MKRKIAAIIAADVVGYSRLMAEDEEETMRRLVSYRSVFNDFITRADGRIFNTAGDAVLAEFPSAVDALRAAIDIQESLRTRNLAYPPSRHMVFRIGLTIGDVIEREGDLLGDGVNIAARLQGLAAPGGICISRSVHEQVANKLSVFFSDLGPQEVKNIPQPVHAFRVDLTRESEQRTVVSPQASSAESISAPGSPVTPAKLPVVSLIAVAAILVGAGVTGSFLFLKKPWSAQEPSANKTVTTTTATPVAPVLADKARPESSRASTAPLRTLLGAPFIAAEAPFICDKCREELGKGLAGQPEHTAVALSLDGGYFWSTGRSTASGARTSALGQCLDARRQACFVYAIDGKISWTEPPPVLPVKPWFMHDPAQEQPFDVSKIPNIYDEDRQRMAQIYARIQGKALALGTSRQWTATGRADTEEEAARIVLERCGYITHSPCRVIALNSTFVVPPASFEVGSSAAMPAPANAIGPPYALTGTALTPGDIPFICDDCRDRIDRELKDRPLHTAIATSIDGGFWYTSNRASAEEARTVVLGNCLGANQTMCFVYAVDGQMVWKEGAPPLPAKPWFTHDPQVERPLDIGTLANLSERSKKFIRDLYSPANTPKAIAVGHGTFGIAFGNRNPLKTENEAGRIALERCGFVAQAPCRIVAINDNLVVKPGPE